MLRKAICALTLIVLAASASVAQRTMNVGDVELRLGMSQDVVMRLLNKYKVSAMGSSFTVMQYNQSTKLYDVLGGVGFEQAQLTYISRSMDTEGWPADEGFSVARAIYDALNGSISRTDSDGAKRTNATIVINNQDASSPTRMNIRTISIYVDERKIILTIVDGSDGKRVSGQVDIRSKPW